MRFSRCSKIVSSSLFRFPGPVSIVEGNDPMSHLPEHNQGHRDKAAGSKKYSFIKK